MGLQMKFWNKYTWLDWKLSKIRSLYYNVVYGFKSLWCWKGVIWHNRAWDYCFIFYILDHQLAQMEECIRNGYNIKADEVADEIKLARLCLKRLIQDDYILQKDPVFKKDRKYLNKIDNKFFCDYMRNQDLKYLFTLIQKKILGWWD